MLNTGCTKISNLFDEAYVVSNWLSRITIAKLYFLVYTPTYSDNHIYYPLVSLNSWADHT